MFKPASITNTESGSETRSGLSTQG